ncbi:hypothetical protein AQUCO_00600027v1 [Aquilegia coerulea]|uniref:Uncharacterized protein n=1 Tax=Aquilegia coerulea TaxID=218851 RepID=A0A2G5EMM8_AQUCA|nr:hypothetical protein AQUCO_00600027v1 [Aquilegia coerulea]
MFCSDENEKWQTRKLGKKNVTSLILRDNLRRSFFIAWFHILSQYSVVSELELSLLLIIRNSRVSKM